MHRKSKGTDLIFDIVISIIIGIIALVFMLPLIHVLSSSFSDPEEVLAGNVGLFPVGFTTIGYEKIFQDKDIWSGFGHSILYTFIGTVISVTCQMLCAYPLSRSDFKGKKILNIFLVIVMFVSGGMIPTYILIGDLQLYDTIWAIILPGCISVFNIIVIRTYMTSSINKELQEAAMIDGCGDWAIFTKIIVPLCRPIIAIMILYAVVGYWNSYFNALLYITNRTDLYPLQNILNNILIRNQSMSVGNDNIALGEQLKYVSIVVSSLPLLVAYPFFQKYFEKGVTVGGIKG